MGCTLQLFEKGELLWVLEAASITKHLQRELIFTARHGRFSITNLGWGFRSGCPEQFSVFLAAPVILVSRARQMAGHWRIEGHRERDFPFISHNKYVCSRTNSWNKQLWCWRKGCLCQIHRKYCSQQNHCKDCPLTKPSLLGILWKGLVFHLFSY